jgi:6-phospho-beta-glucosidase
MKLTIIGGAGVRTPLLIPALMRRAERLGLEEVWLMDDDADKLALIGGLCEATAAEHGATFKLVMTTDAREALRGAHHVITTIRPGLEQGRATDERIALKHGVLGQETTGAGGFAMAMRSIPAILAYARLAAEVAAPDVWIYNFTNPAGLVAQALHDSGIERVVGICDSANGAQHAVSRYLGVELKCVIHEVYGLNHLSWTRSVKVFGDGDLNGAEVLSRLLDDPRFIASTHMSIFDPGLRAWQRMYLNEYLHYYYHRDEALAAILAKHETRGEEVMRLTNELLSRLKAATNLKAQIGIYHESINRRSATYMAHAKHDDASLSESTSDADDEGYAGVALGCIEAVATNTKLYTGVNVPNNGAIDGLRDDDVVEVGCWIDGQGIHPGSIGSVPEHQYVLIRDVKLYERLAVQAILKWSRKLAVEALTVHPLIGSYPLGRTLVDEFIAAHRPLVGEWR